MSKTLDAIVDNASEGEGIICALNRESVQIIFFALSLLSSKRVWLEDEYDTLTDAEAIQIRDMRETVEREIITVFDYEALMNYSREVTIWQDQTIVQSGGALTVQHDASQNYGFLAYISTPIDGNEFMHKDILLDAGEYVFTALGATNALQGKIDWFLDGDQIGSIQDWYTASVVYNALKAETVHVDTAGYHTLTGVINGKNASSGGYYMTLTKIWFRKYAS